MSDRTLIRVELCKTFSHDICAAVSIGLEVILENVR